MIKKLNSIQITLKDILKNKNADEYIYGLPIFFIQKGHNEYLKPFLEYLTIKNNIQTYESYFAKFIKYFRILFLIKKNNIKKNIVHKNYDIFLISNIISESQAKNDYIFGRLSECLNSENIKTLTIYKNFTSNNFYKTKLYFKQPYIILSKSVSFIKEISFIFGIISSYRSLIKLRTTVKNKQSVNFIKYSIKLKYLTPIISNLRLSYQIISLVKKYNPKVIIFPFENHAWERFLINKLKKLDTKIVTAGYQFSTFSKNQFSNNSVLKKNFNPDFVLASGISTYNYLNKVFRKKIKLINFGSHKYFEKPHHKKNFKNFNFLMVPEAPLSEVYEFLKMGQELAKVYPKFNFVLRLHPMSKSQKLIDSITEDIKKYKNLKLSKNKLEKDFLNCSYILYRSSSLCISGSIKGLLPIYVENNGFSIDPFFEINKNFSIKSPNELQKIMVTSGLKKNMYLNKVRNYSLNYFQKKSKKEIIKLFNYFNNTVI